MDVCRICLVTNTKLYDIENCILKTSYETLTRCSLPEDGLSRKLCWECRARLLACARFREKALRSRALLASMAPFNQHNIIRKLESVDRQAHNLVSSLTCSSTFVNQNDIDSCVWIEVETQRIAQTHQWASETRAVHKQEPNVKVKKEIESDNEYDASDSLAWMIFNTECEIKREILPEPSLQSDYNLGPHIELSMETITSQSQAEKTRGNRKDVSENSNEIEEYGDNIELQLAHNSNEVLNYRDKKEEYTSLLVKYWYCSECDFKSIRKGALQVHQKTHSGEKPFKCELCEYSTGRKEVLKQHMLYKHTSEKAFKCSRCDYACHRRLRLEEHEKIHTGERPFECDICGFRSISKMYLKIHKMKVHDIDYRTRRRRKIPLKSDNVRVKKIDNGVNVNTDQADSYLGHEVKSVLAGGQELEDFSYDRVQQHKQPPESTHQIPTEQSSEQNDPEISFQVDLHIKTEDSGFECDKCSNSYDNNMELEKHMLTHDSLEESIGSSGNDSILLLNRHMNSRLVEYACGQCDYKTVKRSKLLIHQREHRRQKTKLSLYEFKASSETSRQHCNSFRNVKSTSTHQTIHKEEPLKCQQCNYACPAKSSLLIHEKTHAEETFNCDFDNRREHDSSLNRLVHDTSGKPFKCDNCEYTCKRKSQMACHMKIHIRTKLKCGICGHGCSRKDLKYHLKKSHSIGTAVLR